MTAAYLLKSQMPLSNLSLLSEECMDTAKAKQVGGNHYNLAIQPVDFIVKNNIPYREANVIKYVTRHKLKNGAEDIRKAIHYLEMILEDYNNA